MLVALGEVDLVGLPYPERTIATEAGKHRLHELFSTLITTLSCVHTAVAFRAGGLTDWPPGTYMSFKSALFSGEVRLPQGGVVENLVAGFQAPLVEVGLNYPSSWEYDAESDTQRIVRDPMGIGIRVALPYFVEFYEDNVSWIRANISYEHRKWGSVWQFARVVRNAIAHNAVSIDDSNFQPVSWHGLTYGPVQNGRKIIGTDLPIADIVTLIVEMNDELDSYGAPT